VLQLGSFAPSSLIDVNSVSFEYTPSMLSENLNFESGFCEGVFGDYTGVVFSEDLRFILLVEHGIEGSDI